MTLITTPLRLNRAEEELRGRAKFHNQSQPVQGERSSRKRQCGEEEEAGRKGQLSGQESEREEKRKGKRSQ